MKNDLTSREKQILYSISEGLTNPQMALELGVGLETVKTHVRRILAKMEANSRAHAVSKGYRRGILKLR